MNDKMTFEQAMNRLTVIISMLERNDLSLDESIKLFEEGLTLVKECDGQLHGFESKVQELMEHYSNSAEGE